MEIFRWLQLPHNMRTAKFSLALTIMLASAGAFAQTGKTLMKITIKDGAVVKTEPVSSSPNSFKPSADQTSNTGTRDTQTLGPIKKSSVAVRSTGDKATSFSDSRAEVNSVVDPKSGARMDAATT
jgi:hypothetical protein